MWRLSAKETVLYNDDFPEPLLVVPELWDGAIGQGAAKCVKTTFCEQADGNWTASVEDNGNGIRNERRLKSWAASKSVDNIHRNGHGSKKALTKFMPDYEAAEWTCEWRGTRNPNLQRMKGPFLGEDTFTEEDETDVTTLTPHGTKWSWKFNPTVLKLNTADGAKSRNFRDFTTLMTALRELVQTRYSDETLMRVDFQFTLVPQTGTPLTESSKTAGWRSLHWQVAHSEDVTKLLHHELPIDGGVRIFDYYRINAKGNTSYPLKIEFPFYGQKNMRASRIHTSLDGRMIEAIPIYRIYGREAPHNDFNGFIGFVDFKPTTPEDFEKMPQPAATKVSFWPSDPRFEEFLASLAPCIREEEARKAAEEVAALEAARAAKAAEGAAKKKAPAPIAAAGGAGAGDGSILPIGTWYRDFLGTKYECNFDGTTWTFSPKGEKPFSCTSISAIAERIAQHAHGDYTKPCKINGWTVMFNRDGTVADKFRTKGAGSGSPKAAPVLAPAPAPSNTAVLGTSAPLPPPIVPLTKKKPLARPSPVTSIHFSDASDGIVIRKGDKVVETMPYIGQYAKARDAFEEILKKVGDDRFVEYIHQRAPIDKAFFH